MDDQDEMELTGAMSVELDVGVELCGGSVVLTIGDASSGVKLTTLVTELIEAHEANGEIDGRSVNLLGQVQHELLLAAHLLGNRIELERDRKRTREEG